MFYFLELVSFFTSTVAVVSLSRHAWLSKYKELSQTALTMGCDDQLIPVLFMLKETFSFFPLQFTVLLIAQWRK